MPERVAAKRLGLTEAALMMQTVGNLARDSPARSAIHLISSASCRRESGSRNTRIFMPPEDGRASCSPAPNHFRPDTSSLETRAVRTNEGYRITGRKIWTTNAQRANKILIIARTTPKDQAKRPTDGLSLFYADFDRKHIEAQQKKKMGRKAVECNTLFIEDSKYRMLNCSGRGECKKPLSGPSERVLFGR